ncbi:uncharacterized protein LOC141854960 isoform X2 [Brevipalpus obovatus]|uniref:uncharacterized protein LOC141854960 isoform X2 n=1 Tax=Brevipalpus obovatus TaxID=246614 RepID=UPI003D9DEA23
MGGVVSSIWKGNSECTTDPKPENHSSEEDEREIEEHVDEDSADDSEGTDDTKNEESEEANEDASIHGEADYQTEANGVHDTSNHMYQEVNMVSSTDNLKEEIVRIDSSNSQPEKIDHQLQNQLLSEEKVKCFGNGDDASTAKIDMDNHSGDMNGSQPIVMKITAQNNRASTMKPKKFVCEFPSCESSYTARQSLNRHIMKQHNSGIESKKRDLSPESDRSNFASLSRSSESSYSNRGKRQKSSETDSVSSRNSDQASVNSEMDELDQMMNKPSKDQVITVIYT